MGMRRDNPPQFSPAYEARIAEKEAKLQWLIARHPGSHELAYYLIFLLLANEQYTKALVECRRVLVAYPGDGWPIVERIDSSLTALFPPAADIKRPI